MELMDWGFEEEMGDVLFEHGDRQCKVKVKALQAMGGMITQEADSMSAMQFRTKRVDKALCMDTRFYKNKGIANMWKHKRCREVVQTCLLHSSESLSWKKEMVDTLHGWESRFLDLMSMRKWVKRGLSLDWFRTDQITMSVKVAKSLPDDATITQAETTAAVEVQGLSVPWFVLDASLLTWTET